MVAANLLIVHPNQEGFLCDHTKNGFLCDPTKNDSSPTFFEIRRHSNGGDNRRTHWPESGMRMEQIGLLYIILKVFITLVLMLKPLCTYRRPPKLIIAEDTRSRSHSHRESETPMIFWNRRRLNCRFFFEVEDVKRILHSTASPSPRCPDRCQTHPPRRVFSSAFHGPPSEDESHKK